MITEEGRGGVGMPDSPTSASAGQMWDLSDMEPSMGATLYTQRRARRGPQHVIRADPSPEHSLTLHSTCGKRMVPGYRQVSAVIGSARINASCGAGNAIQLHSEAEFEYFPPIAMCYDQKGYHLNFVTAPRLTVLTIRLIVNGHHRDIAS